MSNEKPEKKISLLKPYTNNDKLNDMSIEEKAVFLQTIIQCLSVDCNTCPLITAPICNVDGIKQWLESEATV